MTGRRVARIVMVVFGVIAVLFALSLLAGGAALVWAQNDQTNSDGLLHDGSASLRELVVRDHLGEARPRHRRAGLALRLGPIRQDQHPRLERRRETDLRRNRQERGRRPVPLRDRPRRGHGLRGGPLLGRVRESPRLGAGDAPRRAALLGRVGERWRDPGLGPAEGQVVGSGHERGRQPAGRDRRELRRKGLVPRLDRDRRADLRRAAADRRQPADLPRPAEVGSARGRRAGRRPRARGRQRLSGRRRRAGSTSRSAAGSGS